MPFHRADLRRARAAAIGDRAGGFRAHQKQVGCTRSGTVVYGAPVALPALQQARVAAAPCVCDVLEVGCARVEHDTGQPSALRHNRGMSSSIHSLPRGMSLVPGPSPAGVQSPDDLATLRHRRRAALLLAMEPRRLP